MRDIEYNFMGGYKVGWQAEGMYSTRRWFEDGKWYSVADKYFNPFAPCINPEYAYKLDQFKYSAVELYQGDCIMKYLRTYSQYPQAEYLVKLGLSRYTESKQILEKIAKDKSFRKWIARNRADLESPSTYITAIMSAYRKGESIKAVQAYEEAKKTLSKSRYAPIRNMLNGDYKPYIDYIAKQETNNELYLDYLNACNYLGLDMSEARNRYPHDFKHWHDIRIDEYHTARSLKDKEERKELFSKFAKIAEKYLPMTKIGKGDFIVIIAQSPSDLVKEGNALHHCVGKMGYDQKFAREESLIFFIRSKEDIEKPLATVEYSIKSKKILQFYADHNSKPSQSVTEYVNEIWLPYANRAIKKIAA